MGRGTYISQITIQRSKTGFKKNTDTTADSDIHRTACDKWRGNVAKCIWEHDLNRNDPEYACLLVESTIHHEAYNAKDMGLRPLTTRYCGLNQLPPPHWPPFLYLYNLLTS
jgi:hypothetical protein